MMLRDPQRPEPSLLGERYRLLESVGLGSHGEVFQARDERTGVAVAVKLLRERAAGAEARAAFRREATLLASVQSPHVVRVLDAALDDDVPYLVMELLDGRSLDAHLARRGPLKPASALYMTEAVLRGLGTLHRRAILHGDIKPANVVLSPDRGVKLIDFGISRPWVGEWDTSKVEGTPPYLAPELLRGERPDQRTDLYGVGLLLFEALSACPAFLRRGGPAAIFDAILAGQRSALRELAPELDPDIEAFVDRALQREPAERFHDSDDMLAALEPLRRSLPGPPAPTFMDRAQASIAGGIARSRVEALTVESPVRVRYLASGGSRSFLRDVGRSEWEPIDEYCRVLDAALAVLGREAITHRARSVLVAEAADGPFAAIPRGRGKDAVVQVLPQFWQTSFRGAGTLAIDTPSPDAMRIVFEGGPVELRTSPGWRAMLSGSLLGVLQVFGLGGEITIADEGESVTWHVRLFDDAG